MKDYLICSPMSNADSPTLYFKFSPTRVGVLSTETGSKFFPNHDFGSFCLSQKIFQDFSSDQSRNGISISCSVSG